MKNLAFFGLIGVVAGAPVGGSSSEELPTTCSVPAGTGECRSVSNDGCAGGTFHPGTKAPWPCPGDEDIQCCVIEEDTAIEKLWDDDFITDIISDIKEKFKDLVNEPTEEPAEPTPEPTEEPEEPADEPEEPAPQPADDAITCSVPAGSGVCLSVSKDGCTSGSFHPGTGAPWPCPGDDDIQCCVPDSSGGTPATDSSTPDDSSSTPTGGNGHLAQNALDLLKELEGFVPGVYDDAVGIATIGYGHNCEAHPGTCESLSIPLSEADGEKLMIEDLKSFESCVCELPNAAKLNQNQFGALVSFAYNSGCGGVARDWEGKMAEEDFAGICEKLPSTNTLNGLLVTRRTKEQTLCMTETDVGSGC